jgi:hypothetical protein
MPTRASLAKVEEAADQAPSPAEQKGLLDKGLSWAPLDWLLYYKRALLGLHAPEFSNGTDADFNRALFLEQNSLELPLTIMSVCRDPDMPEMLVAEKSLMKRSGSRREELFNNALGQVLDAKGRLEMTTVAEGDPNLEAMAVMAQSADNFAWVFQNFLTSNPSLKGVSPDLASQLFNRWVESGDAGEFINEWAQHPEWHSSGWKAYGRALAKTGRYKDAVALGLQFMTKPPMPDIRTNLGVDQAAQNFQDNPQDIYSGVQLYFAQTAAGENAQALSTLQQLAKLPQRPAYIQYLLAEGLTAAGQDEAAWQALDPLLGAQ